MRIGLYGMPTAGKSYILDKIDFLEVMSGSVLLNEICPTFDSEDDHGKNMAREELAKRLLGVESFIMDGHYAFGDKVAFTDMDGQLYDVILYLYISPDVLIKRMRGSDKNKKYLSYDIEKWQMNEMESLRDYCHKSNKDFYVIDNPKDNYFTDVTEVVEFIKAIVNGFSCKRLAADCVENILNSTDSEVITLLDGDKTITKEDSSHAVFGYITHIYDGNFYTGFQSWRQAEEFKSYSFDDLKELPVINTGKTMVHLIDDDVKVACCVINDKAVPLFDDKLYTVRVSTNSFVGSAVKTQKGNKGPDTTMRLFNQL